MTSPAVQLLEIGTKGDLLAATAGSPVVRGEAPAVLPLPAIFLTDGAVWATAFLRPTYTHGLNVMLHTGGSAQMTTAEAVRAAVDLASGAPFATWLGQARAAGADAISIPRAAAGQLSHLLRDPEAVGRWEWMSTEVTSAPPAVPTTALGPQTRAELDDLLAAHNPRTDGQPFAREGQHWLGVRGDDGSLLAVGCCELEASGAPVLAGITVVPTARGKGLGRAVTAALTRGAVAEHGWCTLGMYSDNAIARGLYLDLGYTIGAEWTSGALPGCPDLSSAPCR